MPARLPNFSVGDTFTITAEGANHRRTGFVVEVDQASVAFTQKRFMAARRFAQAFQSLTPEFGAYMPYSYYLEAGTARMQARPHILAAVQMNVDYINRGVARGLRDLMVVHMNTGATWNTATLRARIRVVWEDVLNAKPRRDAMANSPIEFGFHRVTIRGYGDARSPSEVRKQMQKMMGQRRVLERGSPRRRARSIRGAVTRQLRSARGV